MKMKLYLLLVLAVAFLSTDAQTIYRLQYKSPASGDTATYDAFFSLSSNGMGIVRVRSTAHQSIVEMEFMGEYAMDKSGMPDTSLLMYKGSEPVIVNNKK